MRRERRDEDEAARVRRHLRDVVEDSDLGRREIEDRAGFGRGYLSRLLWGNIELKYWHVIAVLEVTGENPAEFFAMLYPRQHSRERPISPEIAAGLRLNADVVDVYVMGIHSANVLRQRIDRCERELRRLIDEGLLDDLAPQ